MLYQENQNLVDINLENAKMQIYALRHTYELVTQVISGK